MGGELMRRLRLTALAVAAGLFLQAPPAPGDDRAPISVSVLVLNFDPILKSQANARLHRFGKWQAPRKLSEGYRTDVESAAHGRVKFRIVEWRDLDEFPAKKDGFAYTEAEYLACMAKRTKWHDPDALDYEAMFVKHRVVEGIDAGRFDELWIFGGPYFGYGESAMAGPGAFYINGPTFEKVKSKRPFAIMGFNYERGVAEMIHNLCHRTESTLARVYGGWKAEKLDHHWARFAANAHPSGGVAAVGSCHYPPNGERDYDYANRRRVKSSAVDWLAYPNLAGKSETIDCETWGGPDYHRNYMKWWFNHLPHAPGVNADGRLNDWWEYVFNFAKYDERGRRH
jgi:hypothetical protein